MTTPVVLNPRSTKIDSYFDIRTFSTNYFLYSQDMDTITVYQLVPTTVKLGEVIEPSFVVRNSSMDCDELYQTLIDQIYEQKKILPKMYRLNSEDGKAHLADMRKLVSKFVGVDL
jgi:hypothetical protein